MSSSVAAPQAAPPSAAATAPATAGARSTGPEAVDQLGQHRRRHWSPEGRYNIDIFLLAKPICHKVLQVMFGKSLG